MTGETDTAFRRSLAEAKIPVSVLEAPPPKPVPTDYTPLMVMGGVVLAASLIGSLVQARMQRKLMQEQAGGQMKEAKAFMGSTGKVITERPKLKLSDVGGNYAVKAEIQDLIDDIRDHMAGKPVPLPKGMLLTGPPGTGKTLLAKVIAGETGLPFMVLKGSEFSAMFQNVGSARVKDTFAQARELALTNKGCIMFIDEIDALGINRDAPSVGGNNVDREATLTTFLQEMDGFEKLNNVIIIGATNVEHKLDKAFKQRFSRKVKVDNPKSDAERREILAIHTSRLTKAFEMTLENPELAVDSMASLTRGMAGRELEIMVQEAVRQVRREDRKVMTLDDLVEAYLVQVGGGRRSPVQPSRQVRERVDGHELGHMLTGLAAQIPPLVISMLGRGDAAGFVAPDLRALPETMNTGRDYLRRIFLTAGGRAFEETIGTDADISDGWQSDKKKINDYLAAMVSFGLLNRHFIYQLATGDDISKLPAEVQAELNQVTENALQEAKQIMQLVGTDRLKQMIDESLDLPHELIGEAAVNFANKHIPPELLKQMQARFEAFCQNPMGIPAGSKAYTIPSGINAAQTGDRPLERPLTA